MPTAAWPVRTTRSRRCRSRCFPTAPRRRMRKAFKKRVKPSKPVDTGFDGLTRFLNAFLILLLGAVGKHRERQRLERVVRTGHAAVGMRGRGTHFFVDLKPEGESRDAHQIIIISGL